MNRRILALALPNIISNITVPLLGLVDIAIVGHLGDDSLIGGIAIGTAVFNFIYWNFAFLRMGASGCTAQAYGARNFTEIASVFVRALILALAAAFVAGGVSTADRACGNSAHGRHASYDELCGRLFLCPDLGGSCNDLDVCLSRLVHRYAEFALPDVHFDRGQCRQSDFLPLVCFGIGMGYRRRCVGNCRCTI